MTPPTGEHADLRAIVRSALARGATARSAPESQAMSQARRLLNRFSGWDPEEILQELARERGYGLSIETSPELIGTASAICLLDTTTDPPVYRVFHAPNLSAAARRHALAHEAAHLAEDDLSEQFTGLVNVRLRHQCGQPEEEERCELFALLLPPREPSPDYYRLARSLSGGLPR